MVSDIQIQMISVFVILKFHDLEIVSHGLKLNGPIFVLFARKPAIERTQAGAKFRKFWHHIFMKARPDVFLVLIAQFMGGIDLIHICTRSLCLYDGFLYCMSGKIDPAGIPSDSFTFLQGKRRKECEGVTLSVPGDLGSCICSPERRISR